MIAQFDEQFLALHNHCLDWIKNKLLTDYCI